MKHLCYLGIPKEGFSAYLSPVMLISRKVMQGKRVITDFRHLNVRIAKNNLAYPLLKDTFSVLGSSRCEGTISIRFKRCISLIKIITNSKDIVQCYHILAAHHIYIKECLWD